MVKGEIITKCTEWSPLAAGQPLFDWCGAPVDQRMLQALQNCLCCLGHLKTVLHVLLNQSTPLTDQGELLLLGTRTLLTRRTGFACGTWDSAAGVVSCVQNPLWVMVNFVDNHLHDWVDLSCFKFAWHAFGPCLLLIAVSVVACVSGCVCCCQNVPDLLL